MQMTDLQKMKEYKALEMKARRSAYQHERWLRDKVRITERRKRCNLEHPEIIKERSKKYYIENKQAILRAVKEYRLKNLDVIRTNARKYQKTPKGRFSMYTNSAKERGFDFSLSSEEFNNLLFSPCHYCGIEQAMGVDRKESNVGYFSYNVVACCKTCNYMKGTLSYQDFISHVMSIIKNIT